MQESTVFKIHMDSLLTLPSVYSARANGAPISMQSLAKAVPRIEWDCISEVCDEDTNRLEVVAHMSKTNKDLDNVAFVSLLSLSSFLGKEHALNSYIVSGMLYSFRKIVCNTDFIKIGFKGKHYITLSNVPSANRLFRVSPIKTKLAHAWETDFKAQLSKYSLAAKKKPSCISLDIKLAQDKANFRVWEVLKLLIDALSGDMGIILNDNKIYGLDLKFTLLDYKEGVDIGIEVF